MNIQKYCNTVISRLVFLFCPLALVCCDDHELVDTDVHVGYVLTADHHVVSPEAFASGSSVAVGVVFALTTADHPMLAVLLDEVPPTAFADRLGITLGTSGKKDAFDGYANSVAMRNTVTVIDSISYGSPLGRLAFDAHFFGQSDFIPSYAESRLLYSSLSVVNPVIRRLGGTPVSVTADDGACWYWTSTEDSLDVGNRAWLCSMGSGGFQQTPKDECHPCRLVVAMSY